MVSKHPRAGAVLLLSLLALAGCYDGCSNDETGASVDCRWQVQSAAECQSLISQSACVDGPFFNFPDCQGSGCVDCQ